MNAVWRDAFVEESNLAKQVSKLRKLLNTSGDAVIETLPKHGYRFSADLRLVESEDQPPVIAERRTVKRVTFAFDNDKRDQPPLALLSKPKSIGLGTIIAIAGLTFAIVLGVRWYLNREPPVARLPINSIAVLPQRSLTAGEELDALGLGLSDSLITELGSVRHLVVRPIGSVRGFSNSSEDALALGRRLRVDAVLDGTLQEASGRLRINARLISTANGEQIWAEKFDDNFTNVFEVQDRISEQAARALTAMLAGEPSADGPGERLTKRYTENPAAFDAYLKGRYHWNKRTDADFRKAIEYFQSAVELDPDYALAWAGLADSHLLLAVWGTEPPATSMEQAKQAALKALSADADIAEARTSLAFIKWVYDWDFSGADAEFSQAIDLNPNYATAHHWRAYYLVAMGRGDEAIAAIKRAQELEGPLSLGIMTDVGEIYCWAGKYDEAIEHLTQTLQVEPNYAVAHYELGIAYLKKERPRDAVTELERARELESEPRIVSALAFAYGAAGEKDKASKLIADLAADSKKRYVSPFSIAIAHAGLGEDEASIEWLEKARAERSDAMAIVKVHPLLLRLHANSRFLQLLKDVGYPE
jgi:TolB-like protein/Flp pilus assembly protein TadD